MERDTLRGLGLCGVAGAATMLLGDLLMLGVPLGGAEYAALGLDVMTGIPVPRLLVGGALGPVGGLFYAVGAGFVWGVLRPGRLRSPVTAAMAALGVIAGAFHATFPLLGLLATGRPALEAAGQGALWGHAQASTGLLLALAGVAGLVALLGLGFAIATGRSHLPRWAVALSPAVTLPAVYATGLALPAPIGGPVVGGAYNLAMLLSLSTMLGLVLRVGPTRHASVIGPDPDATG